MTQQGMATDALDALITEQMQAHQVPGLAVALIGHGCVAYERGFGVTSIEPDAALPITPQTVFRAGSVTKPMTATLLMRLVEDGLLDLDAPICEYDRDLRLSDPTAAAKITLRMLLSHTSGLPSDLEYHDRRTQRGYGTDLEQYTAEVLPYYRLIAPPGTGFHYSNPGINLAARLGEIVTDKPYPALMRDYLFAPFGMSRSTFDPLEALTVPLALGHARDTSNQVSVKRPFIDNPMEYPCGYALTTAHDLAAFALAHLGDGGLSADVIQSMHHVQADQYNGEGYGLGFRRRQYRGLRFVGHNGAIGKYGAVLAMLPDVGCGMVMLFNRAPGFWGSARQIMEQALDLLSETDVPVSEQQSAAVLPNLGPYAGRYLSYDLGLIEVAPDGIRVNGRLTERPHITRLDDERYYVINGALAEPYHEPPYDVDPAGLACFAGIYDADIDRWVVRVEGDALMIYSEDDRVEVRAVALSANRFACDFGVLDFEDIETGQSGAVVSALGYRFIRAGENA